VGLLAFVLFVFWSSNLALQLSKKRHSVDTWCSWCERHVPEDMECDEDGYGACPFVFRSQHES